MGWLEAAVMLRMENNSPTTATKTALLRLRELITGLSIHQGSWGVNAPPGADYLANRP
jgi:hypothetical protein